MKQFIISGDNRVVLCQPVMGVMVPCGLLSMNVLIRSAAYRGGIAMRDQRAANF